MQYETVTRPIYRGVVRSDANAILLISIDVLKGGSIGSIVKTVLAVVTIRIEEELWMCDITERMVCRHRGGWKWTAACLSQFSTTTAFTEGNNHCMSFFCKSWLQCAFHIDAYCTPEHMHRMGIHFRNEKCHKDFTSGIKRQRLEPNSLSFDSELRQTDK